jgi:hypothetical protein
MFIDFKKQNICQIMCHSYNEATKISPMNQPVQILHQLLCSPLQVTSLYSFQVI